MSQKPESSAQLQFGTKNVILITTAIVSLAVGYLLLSGGDTVVAPILLVLGYCVLFPLGLAL